MYEQKHLPEMPSEAEVGQAVATLINFVMNIGGQVSGTVLRSPSEDNPDGITTAFHFEMHDTRLCMDLGEEMLVAEPIDKRTIN